MALLSGPAAEEYIAPTRHWLEKAVIGLNLCPFAQAVHARGLIRWVVSDATQPEALLDDLADEMRLIAAADPGVVETTLLIHPHVLTDFADFNDFLDPAEARLGELGFDGVLQLASFHPAYQFAGTDPDDITNCTNHSPFPTLHLLRESSLDQALDGFPNPEAIYERNMETLRGLGHEGWKQLGVGAPSGCPMHPAGIRKPDAPTPSPGAEGTLL